MDGEKTRNFDGLRHPACSRSIALKLLNHVPRVIDLSLVLLVFLGYLVKCRLFAHCRRATDQGCCCAQQHEPENGTKMDSHLDLLDLVKQTLTPFRHSSCEKQLGCSRSDW